MVTSYLVVWYWYNNIKIMTSLVGFVPGRANILCEISISTPLVLTFFGLLFLQGNITTSVVLDREQAVADTYTLTVLAADDAIRSRQGTTQVKWNFHKVIINTTSETVCLCQTLKIKSWSVCIEIKVDNGEDIKAYCRHIFHRLTDNRQVKDKQLDKSADSLT